MTDVSIILCSYNRADHLEKTLQSLQQLEVPNDWTVEIILVDNASTDATPAVMRRFEHPKMSVQVVREAKKGLSNARNRGVAEARGQVLLFTDDDVRFPQNWIAGMARPILEDGADAVAGGVALAEHIDAEWMTSRHRSLLASTERIHPEDPERMVGANMAIAKHVFDHIPKFDPELGAGQLGLGEETLFTWQMQAAQCTIVTAFDVVVEHHPDTARLSRVSFCQMAEKAGRSEGYINYHWHGRTDWGLMELVAGLVYYRTKLGWWRVRRSLVDQVGSKRSMAEFELMKRYHRVCQHLIERRRSPKYAAERSSMAGQAPGKRSAVSA